MRSTRYIGQDTLRMKKQLSNEIRGKNWSVTQLRSDIASTVGHETNDDNNMSSNLFHIIKFSLKSR